MDIEGNTNVAEMLDRYPFMLEFMPKYNPHFQRLTDPAMRETMARFATLEMAATNVGIPLDRFLADLQAEIDRHKAPVEEAGDAGEEGDRQERLKGIIRDLHAGADPCVLRHRFAALIKDVGPGEIAAMEQALIEEGLPPEEIQKLCDVHVEIFRHALDDAEAPGVPPGHPVHTFMAENAALGKAAGEFRSLLDDLGTPPDPTRFTALKPALAEAIHRLSQVDVHYVRKENQLFPYLEKHGVSGPPQVMWGKHDEVRALLKGAREALIAGDAAAFGDQAANLVQGVQDMCYKEDNILFPMSLETLDEADWPAVRRGEEEVGFILGVTPGTQWEPVVPAEEGPGMVATEHLPLDTGLLSLEQVNLLLNHLPVEVSFVDENDEVRYYSGGDERIFPRSPGVIGRKVQNCHPPKSLDMVNRILSEFKAGNKDEASFWIPFGDKFVMIRYFAVRDAQGAYRGCLEVTQDIAGIRGIEGEKRLLDWDG